MAKRDILTGGNQPTQITRLSVIACTMGIRGWLRGATALSRTPARGRADAI